MEINNYFSIFQKGNISRLNYFENCFWTLTWSCDRLHACEKKKSDPTAVHRPLHESIFSKQMQNFLQSEKPILQKARYLGFISRPLLWNSFAFLRYAWNAHNKNLEKRVTICLRMTSDPGLCKMMQATIDCKPRTDEWSHDASLLQKWFCCFACSPNNGWIQWCQLKRFTML